MHLRIFIWEGDQLELDEKAKVVQCGGKPAGGYILFRKATLETDACKPS